MRSEFDKMQIFGRQKNYTSVDGRKIVIARIYFRHITTLRFATILLLKRAPWT